MRYLLLALPLLLAACSPDPTPTGVGDEPTAQATEVDADAPASSASATDAAFLPGVWQEVGRKRTLDGVMREGSGIVTWTFRDDGTAFHAQTFESMGPVTEDLTWTLDGSNLVLHNAAQGDERHNFEVVERGDGSMTLFTAARNDHYVLERE